MTKGMESKITVEAGEMGLAEAVDRLCQASEILLQVVDADSNIDQAEAKRDVLHMGGVSDKVN